MRRSKVILFDVNETLHTTRRFKPSPETYQYAAHRLGVDLAGITMVAAHYWDIAGAQQAGCTTAFIARPGMFYSSLFEEPSVF